MSRPIEDYFITDEQLEAFDVWMERNPIRVWRKQEGVTIQRFAQAVGINWRRIVCYERGDRRPRDTTLHTMERYCKIDGLLDKWREWEIECPIPNRGHLD